MDARILGNAEGDMWTIWPPATRAAQRAILRFQSGEDGGSKAAGYEYVTLSPSGLAYIQLRQGEYFIYKDSTTAKTDSVVVTQSMLQQNNSTGLFGVIQNLYSLTLSKIDS
jgi:hypothetical protein